MTLDQLTPWAVHHPVLTATGAGTVLTLTAVLAWAAVRTVRTSAQPASVRVAAVGAIVCTVCTADTSWRFAADHLDMHNLHERSAMFAAAEVALVACGLMARANKAATATDQQAGTTGVPGTLVWAITGVQVIPAYAEFGPVGGTVRAFIGPIMAGLLWHLAMGLEIRITRPRALASGLLAQIGRALRERLLSHLGLAVRDRTAEQITRDRWTARAVDLVAQLAHRSDGWAWYTTRLERRLSRAIGRSQVGSDPQQRRQLLQLVSARLHSTALPHLDLPSPWEVREPVSPPRPAPVVAYRELRGMPPMDAVLTAASAHPGMHPDELRQLLHDHGVIVSEAQISVALRARASAHPAALQGAFAAGQTLFAVHAHWDGEGDLDAAEGDPDASDADVPDAAADLTLLPDAQRVEKAHQAQYGRPASLRALQRSLRIGQPRAQRMRALLDGVTQP